MVSREDLQYKLEEYCPNVYYQPPSNLQIKYPCIIYARAPNQKWMANDKTYHRRHAYNLTVIDRDPESNISDRLDDELDYCNITQHYVVDNLYHTILTLYI